jgi:hypothetical protein
MHLICFNEMRKTYVGRIIYSNFFLLFGVYIYIYIYIYINEVNALDGYMKITFTECVSWNKGEEV